MWQDAHQWHTHDDQMSYDHQSVYRDQDTILIRYNTLCKLGWCHGGLSIGIIGSKVSPEPGFLVTKSQGSWSFWFCSPRKNIFFRRKWVVGWSHDQTRSATRPSAIFSCINLRPMTSWSFGHLVTRPWPKKHFFPEGKTKNSRTPVTLWPEVSVLGSQISNWYIFVRAS